MTGGLPARDAAPRCRIPGRGRQPLVVVSIVVLDKIKIDDPVGAISVHGVCGIWGILACALFDTGDNGFTIIGQLTGVLAVGGAAFVFSLVVFGVLKVTMGIRVSAEEEAEGLDLGEHGSSAYPDFQTVHKG